MLVIVISIIMVVIGAALLFSNFFGLSQVGIWILIVGIFMFIGYLKFKQSGVDY